MAIWEKLFREERDPLGSTAATAMVSAPSEPTVTAGKHHFGHDRADSESLQAWGSVTAPP